MKASFYLLLLPFLFACTQSSKVSKQSPTSDNQATDTSSWYTQGTQSYDGTGKYYQGREISQVMGHLGAPG